MKAGKRDTAIMIHCDKRRKAGVEACAKQIGVAVPEYLLFMEYWAASK